MKELLKSNLYIENGGMKLKHRQSNKKILALAREVDKMDLICPTSQYQAINNEIQKLIQNPGDFVGYKCSYGESIHYGHLHSIKSYANLLNVNSLYVPLIEHGLFLNDRKIHANRGWIFQGEYRKKFIHNLYPFMPAFAIGPYIHYANHFYNDHNRESLKNKWKKTILIFPQHTFEASSAEYDCQEFVDTILRDHVAGYDSVVACLYYNDFNSVVEKVLRSRGIPVVSAGYRFDNNFIRRLKTILSLADTVVSNYIGTHVGYCLHMNTPFKFINSNIVIRDVVAEKHKLFNMNESVSRFVHMFDINNTSSLSPADLEYCNYYFGINQLKSKDELRAIIEINQIIVKRSCGWTFQFENTAKKLLYELLSSSTESDRLKYKLLKNAISN